MEGRPVKGESCIVVVVVVIIIIIIIIIIKCYTCNNRDSRTNSEALSTSATYRRSTKLRNCNETAILCTKHALWEVLM